MPARRGRWSSHCCAGNRERPARRSPRRPALEDHCSLTKIAFLKRLGFRFDAHLPNMDVKATPRWTSSRRAFRSKAFQPNRIERFQTDSVQFQDGRQTGACSAFIQIKMDVNDGRQTGRNYPLSAHGYELLSAVRSSSASAGYMGSGSPFFGSNRPSLVIAPLTCNF